MISVAMNEVEEEKKENNDVGQDILESLDIESNLINFEITKSTISSSILETLLENAEIDMNVSSL